MKCESEYRVFRVFETYINQDNIFMYLRLIEIYFGYIFWFILQSTKLQFGLISIVFFCIFSLFFFKLSAFLHVNFNCAKLHTPPFTLLRKKGYKMFTSYINILDKIKIISKPRTHRYSLNYQDPREKNNKKHCRKINTNMDKCVCGKVTTLFFNVVYDIS